MQGLPQWRPGGVSGSNCAAFYPVKDGYHHLCEGIHEYLVPGVANTWYVIQYDLDWANQRLDWYINGVLEESNVDFRGPASDLREMCLYNSDDENAQWDEILIY